MEEGRKKGLCYNCDDKWSPNHKRKGAKLFLLEGLDFGPELNQVSDYRVEWKVRSRSSVA